MGKVTEEQILELLKECQENINNGDTDNFQSYEEGIKDALEWVYFGGNRPIVKED